MEEVVKLLNEINTPFYKDVGFWISSIIGLASVFFSIIAFIEARRAKEAANAAGQTVKIQTITIELTEIIQRLDKIDLNINYQDARDFFSEINRKVRRILSPYKSDESLHSGIQEILKTLNELKKELEGVKPFNKNNDDPSIANSVYYAIEGEFSTLSGLLAELSGLMEQKSIEQ